MMVNCIAVDDEPLALRLVCSFIEQTPFLRLIGSCGNSTQALEILNDADIHLIFLDIQMPNFTGLQLARILGAGNMRSAPRIVFTTAYNHYAVEGYKVDAVDYLLKPFNYEEFLRSANKVRLSLEVLEGIKSGALKANPSQQEYLYLKVDHQLIQVAYNDILYVEAFRDYVKVHVIGREKPLMSLTTLKSVEQKLPAHLFMRVHKSYLVSLARIHTVSKSAVHIGNVVIAIGDQYREGLRQFIDRWTI